MAGKLKVLDAQSYDEILTKIKSEVEEERAYALSCIELTPDENITFILLIRKLAGHSEEWNKYAPNIVQRLIKLGIDEKHLSYKDILLIIKDTAPKGHIEFYLNQFQEVLRKSILDLGYEHMDDLKIKVTQDAEEPLGIKVNVN